VPTRIGPYAWVAFALVFGLMLSDYLARQVVTALFPFLKAEWSLTDTALASLVSVVSLTVGVMTLPVSFLADRWGQVRSATLMALLWAAATVTCGFAGSFTVLLVARTLVGLSEAGYGSAGGAILTSVFPPRLHGTVVGAFIAAGLFGSVLGVMLGGVIADAFGWRAAFFIIGAAGIVLAIAFPLAVREPARAHAPGASTAQKSLSVREVAGLLGSSRTAVFTYVGAGLQWFTIFAVIVWMPSYLNRYHGLSPSAAGVKAGALLLAAGVGMVLLGMLADRVSQRNPVNKLRISALYAALSCALLLIAFMQSPGTGQMLLVGAGMFLSGGHVGPSGAIVAMVTDPRIRATALGMLTVSNQILGVAPGPFVTGLIADRIGLQQALSLAPLASVLVVACFLMASRYCESEGHRGAAT
jgi:MFS family permease